MMPFTRVSLSSSQRGKTSGSQALHPEYLKTFAVYFQLTEILVFYFACSLTAKDIVYIGLRDVDDAERYLIQQLGIRAYTMRDVDRNGIVRVVQDALLSVNPGLKRPIHLSFDVDGLDPGVTPSTGTPGTSSKNYT